MNLEELMNKISEVEREIDVLPEGSITKKKIKEKEYFYHRINRDGKRIEKYIRFEDLSELREEIEKRKKLEKQLKDLKTQVIPRTYSGKKRARLVREEAAYYKTTVRTGERLRAQITSVKKYKKRECYKELKNYIFGEQEDKVFVIYGLRRTGKTTMVRQILSELSEKEFRKAAFIQVRSRDTLADIDEDLRVLESKGYKYVFIDEVTLMEDFIEGAAIFSDIYASSGMKIVLSGTDSLGFVFSKEEQLYDRCIMMHTTFIPYREFEKVLGIKGIDEYIRYGGTMSLSGVHYNEQSIFANVRSAEEYIDTAIAKNIQHSLSMYEYGGHFRSLLDLYEKGELTNVINRVVENINHSFTKRIVEKAFKSHDLAVTASNLLRDRDEPINIKNHIDVDFVTHGMMQMLDILNKEEQSIDIQDFHMIQIEEYLTLLDLIMKIDLEYLPYAGHSDSITVLTQPGMRYAQANAIVSNLLLDAKFAELSVVERNRILERLLSEIRGRMMEEIILLETKIANPDKKVFKLQFSVGEFDMVIFDPKKLNCKIYEVKYSKEMVGEQSRHLCNEEKCSLTSHRYGEITGKYVIYRGENGMLGDITYINVEEYLNAL